MIIFNSLFDIVALVVTVAILYSVVLLVIFCNICRHIDISINNSL